MRTDTQCMSCIFMKNIHKFIIHILKFAHTFYHHENDRNHPYIKRFLKLGL